MIDIPLEAAVAYTVLPISYSGGYSAALQQPQSSRFARYFLFLSYSIIYILVVCASTYVCAYAFVFQGLLYLIICIS